MIYAYMRISTQKESQKTDRQKVTLEKYAKENGFEINAYVEERVSGKVKAAERSQYSKLKENFKQGDILLITDIDRLGRNADDTIMELKDLKSKGIRVVALDIPYMNKWDKVNDDSIYEMLIDIVITLKAHMAQQEREKISARIKQGLEASTKKKGRPCTTEDKIPAIFLKHYPKYKSKDINVTEFARLCNNMSRTTIYKYIKLVENKK